ncbi:uncharacterized protein LOC142572725 isoform X4 [Dermacentor variabilis]|uniref:uncharacterized protein LOC142572725 isoform X4 n=1 Tax=Dermacentor variabilis TaxID=34621 RepID=UPI003F5B7B41
MKLKRRQSSSRKECRFYYFSSEFRQDCGKNTQAEVYRRCLNHMQDIQQSSTTALAE